MDENKNEIKRNENNNIDVDRIYDFNIQKDDMPKNDAPAADDGNVKQRKKRKKDGTKSSGRTGRIIAVIAAAFATVGVCVGLLVLVNFLISVRMEKELKEK